MSREVDDLKKRLLVVQKALQRALAQNDTKQEQELLELEMEDIEVYTKNMSR